MKTKFKVGDVVRLKVSPKTRFHIIEVNKQICYADCVQEWYTGRCYSWSQSYVKEGRFLEPAIRLTKFNLVELEAFPDVSKQVKALKVKISKAQLKKEAYIKDQDFEKAADSRVEERELMDELEKLNS